MKQQAVEICTVTIAIMCTKTLMGYQINKNGVAEDVEGFRWEKNTEFSKEILRRKSLKWRIILTFRHRASCI